jgi:hypothetical protein
VLGLGEATGEPDGDVGGVGVATGLGGMPSLIVTFDPSGMTWMKV